MLTIRSLRRLSIIGLFGVCLIPVRLPAQRPYDEAGVRLVLLDITLGQDYAYYRGRISQPDVREAIRRWDAGVRVRNAEHFERGRAQRGRGVGHYTFRDRDRDAQGMDVILTTDPERPVRAPLGYNEAQVRLILLDITLARNYAYYRSHLEQPDVREAIRRWDGGVRVRNADHFGRVRAQRGRGVGHYTFRDRSRDAQGMDVVLTTDRVRERPVRAPAGYHEGQVRLILLDITLGQSYAYYRGHIEQPDVREAIRRWDAGVRVVNGDRFETRRGPNGWHRTYRGSNRDADGMDVVLTTDAGRERGPMVRPDYNDAQVRLILLDLALGQTEAYYRSHLDQPDVREALHRWDAGVRVRNIDRFERRRLTFLGAWHRVYRGTNRDVDGRDVVLTSDAEPQRRVEPPPHAYNEAMVRLILLDIALANDYLYYRARLDQPDVREAVRRWDAGVRVRNANQFERRTRGAGDVHRRWRGSNREADGMDVVLTTDPERRRP